MKELSLITIVLTLISCSFESTGDNKEKSKDILKTIPITDNTEILGTWSMCSSFGNGTMMQMNDCPKISFNYNGIGTIQDEYSVKENFHWTFKDSILTIINIFPHLENTFSDTSYIIELTKKRGMCNLTITQRKLGYQYYLTR